MRSSPQPVALQQHALEAFTVLSLLRPRWAGQLVLSVGLDEQGAALLIAANIAGAVSLAIDDDLGRIREVVRTGAADFVVNTLDEAIRAMKNEVRKQAPLSVALQAAPDTVLAESVERGLAPALFACFAHTGFPDEVTRAAESFDSLGAVVVNFEPKVEASSSGFRPVSSHTLLSSFLSGEGWSAARYTASSLTELRSFDQAALHLLGPTDILRRRWFEGAQSILARQRPPHRCLWLNPVEFERLSSNGFLLSRDK